MPFACCFPGCDREQKDIENVSKLKFFDRGWLFFEAPELCYEQFVFCPEHGDMLKQKNYDFQQSVLSE